MIAVGSSCQHADAHAIQTVRRSGRRLSGSWWRRRWCDQAGRTRRRGQSRDDVGDGLGHCLRGLRDEHADLDARGDLGVELEARARNEIEFLREVMRAGSR